MLIKITREAEANIIQRVVYACILPILIYKTLAWWLEQTQTNDKGDTIQNDMKTICKKLDKAQNKAFNAILLV